MESHHYYSPAFVSLFSPPTACAALVDSMQVAGTWRFPGTGEFQNYDKYMMERLRLAAEAEGKPEWGRAGPHDAGGYNGKPDETGFFTDKQGNWESPYGPLRFPPDRAPTFSSGDFVPVEYASRLRGIAHARLPRPAPVDVCAGKFFLSWYSDQLINHGDRILGAARVAFRDHGDVLLMVRRRSGASLPAARRSLWSASWQAL